MDQDGRSHRGSFQAIDFQTEYTRDLITPTDYPRLDVDEVARMFKEWEHHKMDNILSYRDHAFKSTLTGTLAPVHHTPWMKALDDSMEAFPQSADHQAGGRIGSRSAYREQTCLAAAGEACGQCTQR